MATDEAYQVAARAFSGSYQLGHEPAVRAAVDAVWDLAVAEGRRQAAEAIRGVGAATDAVTVKWAAFIAAGSGAPETAAAREDHPNPPGTGHPRRRATPSIGDDQ